MNIHEALKQLKTIAPDPAYARRSRAMLFGDADALAPRLTVWQVFSHSAQFAAAVGLAGLLLIIGVSGFSLGKFFSPFGLGSLDTARLRAEAEAVDAQIELTAIAYPDAETGGETTVKGGTARAKREQAADGGGAPTSTREVVSIDEALDILSQ